MFSNDDITYSAAEAYAATKSWTLDDSSGDGLKQVYVMFKDSLGNWNEAGFSDEITLDTIAPVVLITSPEDESLTNQTSIEVIYDVDGLRLITSPNGDRTQMKHSGNVIIYEDVEIGPYTVIHRGLLDSTIIKKGVKIGSLCNIGHNCYIGKNTVLAANVTLSGSIKIGNDCWFGSGSIIRHNINICNNVLVGTGSVVTKNITKSGIYVGNPARFLKEYNGNKGWDS